MRHARARCRNRIRHRCLHPYRWARRVGAACPVDGRRMAGAGESSGRAKACTCGVVQRCVLPHVRCYGIIFSCVIIFCRLDVRLLQKMCSMPHHKSQHYVPRCYLRNFAADNRGLSINVYNIKNDKFIERAPIKSQCARSYFYGDDLIIEKSLQPIEGEYSRVCRKIFSNEDIFESDMKFLIGFSFLQYLRTDIAAQRTMAAHADMARLVQERVDDDLSSQMLSEKDIITESMKTFSETVDILNDLKAVIIENRTKFNFVTSDDPAIQINRYYSQKLGPRGGSAGLKNSGLIFVLPISPRYCFVSYDGGVYTVPNKRGHKLIVRHERDVQALNELQFLKSSYNIYFQNWPDKNFIELNFKLHKNRRPESWHKINYAVKDEENSKDGYTRYKVVHTERERLAAAEALMHLESVMLVPTQWLSELKFREKMRYVDTGTGAGFLRPNSSIY